MTTTAAPPARSVRSVALGLLGGLALGVVARAWMRLISDDYEFTWAGTGYIVGAFAVFGAVQAWVSLARRQDPSWRRVTAVRSAGVVATLPLFMGAGALMLPTVIGGGLAAAHRGWHVITRGVLVLLALAPVAFVVTDLVDTFGWSVRTVTGSVGVVLLYGTIVWLAQSSLRPPSDHQRLPASVRWGIGAVALIAFLVPLTQGGIE